MALILKSICWNTNGDQTNGSINCRKNYDVAIEPNCTAQGDNTELVGVFVPQNIGGSIELYIEIYNDGDEPIDGVVVAHESIKTPILGDVLFTGTRFPARTLTGLQAQINTAHIKVASFTQELQKVVSKWEWTYTTPVGTNKIKLCDTTQIIYMLPKLPVAAYFRATDVWRIVPELYNANMHNYIWTELLDICCKACDDYGTKNGHRPSTDLEYIEAFVYGLNHCSSFHYDIYTGASDYTMKDPSGDGSVKLKKFVRDYKNTYPSNLNCTDCASIVAIEGLACGISTYTARIVPAPPPLSFDCNPIIAIGYDAWEVPFGSGFSYHEVTVLGQICDKDTGICDACLHLDSGDIPSNKDPAGKTALLPIAYPFAETSNHQVLVPPATAYTGVFYRERLAANLQNCFILSNAFCITGINNNLSAREAAQMPGDSQFLGQVKAQYGLDQNPLHAGKLSNTWETALESMGLDKLGNWTLVEDYERNRCYELLRGDNRFQVQFWFAMDEEEAWLLLLTRLAAIANPNVERNELGDIAFQIGETWKLFVTKNVLVEVFCETHSVTETAEDIVACFN